MTRLFCSLRLYGLPVFLMFLLLPATALAWPAVVVRVMDGDTVLLAPVGSSGTDIHVRLYGIDAPELSQPGGPAAFEALSALLQPGDAVDVVDYNADPPHNKTALLMRQGRFVNLLLLEQGHGWVFTPYCKAAFCPQWKEAERKARQERLGLWSAPDPTPPWLWRREQESRP